MLSLDNKYVRTTVLLFLFLYGWKAAPALPPTVDALFHNDFFRVAFLAAIVYTGSGNVMFSLAVPLILIVSLKVLARAQRSLSSNSEGMVAVKYEEGEVSHKPVQTYEVQNAGPMHTKGCACCHVGDETDSSLNIQEPQGNFDYDYSNQGSW